jgi:hypothetical protein
VNQKREQKGKKKEDKGDAVSIDPSGSALKIANAVQTDEWDK